MDLKIKKSFNYAKAESVNKKYLEIQKNEKKIKADLENVVTTLSRSWSGEAFDAFSDAIKRLGDATGEVIKGLGAVHTQYAADISAAKKADKIAAEKAAKQKKAEEEKKGVS